MATGPAPGEELNPGAPTVPRPAATVILLRGGADALEVLRAAAVREVGEEAGLALPDPAALVPFARWITPERVRIRYDTTFYLAPAPAGQRPRPDGREIVAVRWLRHGGRAAPLGCGAGRAPRPAARRGFGARRAGSDARRCLRG